MKVFITTIAILLPSISLASIPAFPMAFWGTVSIDGNFAPIGSIVRVYDGLTEVGKATVQENGIYGYTEPTKQKLVVGEAQGTLTFTIQTPSVNADIETQGLSLISHPSFESGETINKNLAFTTIVVVNNQPSVNGGGGGGGKPKKEVPVSSLVLGTSTTTSSTSQLMSEDELRITLQKQLISLLTQLIMILQLRMGTT